MVVSRREALLALTVGATRGGRVIPVKVQKITRKTKREKGYRAVS
jgi:hypothetical protein